MKPCLNKWVTFAVIAMICVTIATIYLKYDGDVYLKLVGAIVGMFIVVQIVIGLKKEGKHD